MPDCVARYIREESTLPGSRVVAAPTNGIASNSKEANHDGLVVNVIEC